MTHETVAVPTELEDLGDTDALPRAQAAFRVLERCDDAANAEWRDRVRARLSHALPYFPELAGATLTVARLSPDAQEGARANWYNDLVFLPVETTPPMDTVFHELAHLAIWRQHQDGADVPHTSEPFCSLFATARIPADWIQRKDISYLGPPGVPTHRWPAVAQRALDYREEHGANSHYIKRAKEWLAIPPEKEADRTL